MPTPYEVLNARVKQKIDTEAQWIAEESTFGVIFEGEQAFVKNASTGLPVNFKIGDGTKVFSDLPYFIAYYTGVTSQKVLSYISQNTDITVTSTFRNFSEIQTIAIYNASGSPINLRIGTTNGGAEICATTIPTGAVALGLKNLPTTAETLYLTGLAGNDYTLFILYFQYDEAPVIPPTGSGTFKYPKGHVGMYYPVSPADLAATWDFTTGLGKSGTGYDNCALCGTNGLPSMDGKIAIGYINGDTIGGSKGSVNNLITLDEAHLPIVRVGMFYNEASPGDTPADFANAVKLSRNTGHGQTLDYQMGQVNASTTDQMNPNNYRGKTAPFGGGQQLNITPDSVIFLYYVAIS